MIRRFIIITTGKYGEKNIPKIAQSLRLQIIIYCMNIYYHKQWSAKYE